MADLYRLDIVVSENDFPLAEALVGQHISFGWEEESLPTGESRLRVHCEDAAILDTLGSRVQELLPSATLSRETLEDKDWTDAWRDFFTPVQAGTFLILPPWLAGTSQPGRISLLIEPKSAFGTGHHPTTTLCLDAISQLHAAGVIREGQTFLDLGTGTGILGIACVKLGMHGLALDIDPLAVANATENCRINSVGDTLSVRQGSAEAAQGHQFDLILANILAAPLKELAPQIISLLRPGGALVLSGFLKIQTGALEEAYKSLGLPGKLTRPSTAADPTCTGSPDRDEWVCLMWPSTQGNSDTAPSL